MIILNFFCVNTEKIPIKPVRLEGAFVIERIPRLFAFLVKSEKDKERKPKKSVWKGLEPKPLRLWTYPEINPAEWYTFEKKNDKVKRVYMSEYLRRISDE